jgi:hypothetical protein
LLGNVVSECQWHGHRSLKVIHGHGGGGEVSRIKPHVLEALLKNAKRLRLRLSMLITSDIQRRT